MHSQEKAQPSLVAWKAYPADNEKRGITVYKFKEIILDSLAGCEITQTIADAIHISSQYGWTDFGQKGALVKFDFNDVMVSVQSDSDPALIHRDWSRAMSGYIEKATVGPYPNLVLTDKEKENDARIEAENERKRQEWQAEYRAKAQAKRDRIEARMSNAPVMEFSNEEAWHTAKAVNENQPYGAGILSYAERWARMMQLEISEGKTLEEVWNSTSFEADLEGQSGASQGLATHLLTQSWVHGAELRRLHNTYYGSDSTEATVNPAVLIVGTS